MFAHRYWAYLIALGIVVFTTLVGKLFLLIPFFDYNNMDMLYLMAVALSTFYLGFGPSILVSGLGVVCFDFFFIPPLYHFTVADERGAVNLLVLLLIGLIISSLAPGKRRL